MTLFLVHLHTAYAESNRSNIEVTLNYVCGINFPGLPKTNSWTATLNTNAPNSVAPGQEFYLTDTSILLTTTINNRSESPRLAIIESTNFVIQSENTANTYPFPLQEFETEIPAGEMNHTFYLNGDSPVDFGSFVAGEEGEVLLTSDGLSLGVKFEGDPLATGMVCDPVEGQTTIARIPIDGEAPVINLNGELEMEIKRGDPYEEPGATAIDNIDGDVSEKIEISGDVDTSTIGTYTITYTVSDSVGNEATAERIVNVVEPYGTWYTGESSPDDNVGSNGDLYLDTTTGDIYKRDSNTWTKISNLKGDDGKQGSAILTGTGAPRTDDGKEGDLYFNTETGDVYEKTANGWKKIMSLQGPRGPQGPKGEKGLSGSSGGGDASGDGGGKRSPKSLSGSIDSDSKGKTAQGGKLPKTATVLPTIFFIGTLLIAAGSILFLRRRQATN